jgi:KDO2-lipid IV(A) lauroyltransferase
MIPSGSVVRLAVRVLGVVPAAPVRLLARRCASLAFTLSATRARTITQNLVHLAPDLTPAARRTMARRTFVNMADAAVDLWRLPSLDLGDFNTLVGVRGQEHLDQALAMNRGVIIVTPHLGPYELGGAWLALAGYPAHAMVETLDDDTNAALALYRAATGLRLVPRTAGLRPLLRILRDHEIVVLVADRVIGEGAEGVVVDFGRGRRAIPSGPAALALATGAPIIVGSITRSTDPASRYLVQLETPITATASGDARSDREKLTRQVGARLAAHVQANPDQWFVFQPQWMPPLDDS